MVHYKVKKMVPAFDLPGAVRFNDALAQGRGKSYTPAKVGPDDIAVLQYTGGTTGVSKGAGMIKPNMATLMNQIRVKDYNGSHGTSKWGHLILKIRMWWRWHIRILRSIMNCYKFICCKMSSQTHINLITIFPINFTIHFGVLH